MEDALASPESSPPAAPRELASAFDQVGDPARDGPSPPPSGSLSSTALTVRPSAAAAQTAAGARLLGMFPASREDVAAGLDLVESFVDSRVSMHMESQQAAYAGTLQQVKDLSEAQARAQAEMTRQQSFVDARLGRQDQIVTLLSQLLVRRDAPPGPPGLAPFGGPGPFGLDIPPQDFAAPAGPGFALPPLGWPGGFGPPLGPGGHAPTGPCPPGTPGPLAPMASPLPSRAPLHATPRATPPAPPAATRSPTPALASSPITAPPLRSPPPGLQQSPVGSTPGSSSAVAPTCQSPALSGKVGSLRLANTGTAQTRLSWSPQSGDVSDAAPYGPSWPGPSPVCLSATVRGPSSVPAEIMGGPFGFSFAQAAVQQHEAAQRACTTPSLVDSTIGHELAVNAQAEAVYRETLGHPASFQAVADEQSLRRECGLLWVDPTRLVTPSDRPLVLQCDPTPGGSCAAVLSHFQGGLKRLQDRVSCLRQFELADATPAASRAPPVRAGDGAPSPSLPATKSPAPATPSPAAATAGVPAIAPAPLSEPSSPRPQMPVPTSTTPKRLLAIDASESPTKRVARAAQKPSSGRTKPTPAAEISVGNILPSQLASRPRSSRAASREPRDSSRDSTPAPAAPPS